MQYQRKYRDMKVEIEEYDLTFNVLSNPTTRELNNLLEVRGYDFESDETKKAADRAKYGEMLHLFFAPSSAAGFDFSSPGAALATVESEDLPLDLIEWFRLAPLGAVRLMREDIRGNLLPS